jgi:hypothetical protein
MLVGQIVGLVLAGANDETAPSMVGVNGSIHSIVAAGVKPHSD